MLHTLRTSGSPTSNTGRPVSGQRRHNEYWSANHKGATSAPKPCRARRTTRVEYTTLTSRERTTNVPKAQTRSPAKLANKPPQTYTPSNCGPGPFFSRSGEGAVRTIGEMVRPRRATHTLRTSRSPREVIQWGNKARDKHHNTGVTTNHRAEALPADDVRETRRAYSRSLRRVRKRRQL